MAAAIMLPGVTASHMSPAPLPREPSSLPAAIRREALWLAGSLVFGVLVAPALLGLVGAQALGPYAGGGMADLLASFFRGLAALSFAFWAVALIPYLVTLLARALIGLARGFPAAD